ncbi:MAG: EAL domain-containing protein [Pseudomonadota bacterium]|nr:EAL domain-containing protein [Pseudomonadota bacterium]
MGITSTYVSITNILRRLYCILKTEKGVQSSAQYIHSLIEASIDPFVIINIEGKITDVNMATEKLSGKDRGSLVGRDFVDLFTDSEYARKANDLVFLQGSVADYPLAFWNVSGQFTEVIFNANVYKNSDGEVQAIFATARDITANKSCLAHTKLLLDASLDAIVSMDQSGMVTDWNFQAEKIFGYSQKQAIGHELATLIIPPAFRIAHRNGMARFFKNRIPHVIGNRTEMTGMRADGREFPLELTVAMLEEGEELNFTAYIRDISKRNQVIEALHQSEQQTRAALAELKLQKLALDKHAIVAITDVKGLITYANSKFCEISGYSLEELIGQNHKILNSGYHPKGFFKNMYREVASGKLWQKEVCNRAKDGSLYWVDTTILPSIGDDGKKEGYISIRTDITERKMAIQKSNHLALYDALTDLPNRRLLQDRLNQVLAFNTRSKHRAGLLFIDLDHFKSLNDTLGHDVGDFLLKEVAIRLTSLIHQDDTVARLGGDEFVVLLKDLSEDKMKAAEQVEVVGEKILALINQPYQLSDQLYNCTCSVGVTLFDGLPVERDELFKQADIAMYEAKKSGRNVIRFFDPKMQDLINIRVNMETDLRIAIEQNDFQLYYQLQVDNNGQVIGAEALLRWLHRTRGFVSPLDFIPLAEETGQILPIGEWVLDTACAQLAIWQQNPLTQDLILAVNVSAKQFNIDDFVEQVRTTIAQHIINPSRLKLELTEGILVANINDIITKMDELIEIGIRFSLDDFGTGYSSLQYLKKMPLHQLKIDQSFIREIIRDDSDKAIVRTIITMANGLNIDVIAEGVETVEQRQFLLDNGCMHYQGYLFSKPVPIEEFEALLKKG